MRSQLDQIIRENLVNPNRGEILSEINQLVILNEFKERNCLKIKI